MNYLNDTGLQRLVQNVKTKIAGSVSGASLSSLIGTLKGGTGGGIDWTYAASVSTLPCDFYYGQAVILNNELHILGGGASNTSHYKWTGSSWTSVSTLPYNFYASGAVVLNNEIHILGSGASGNYTKHYKWNGSSWTSVSTLPYNFWFSAAVVLGSDIHILGSYTSGCTQYHYKWNGSSWSSVSTLPYDFNHTNGVVVLNNEIHILGSMGNGTGHYKWNGSSWTEVSTLPFNFYNGCAIVFDDEIHILGTGSPGDQDKHYKWDGTSWSSVSTLPYDFESGKVIVYNNLIYILGGIDSDVRTSHYQIGKVASAWVEVDDETTGDFMYYFQTVDIEGMSVNDIVFIAFDPTSMEDISEIPEVAKSQIYCVSQLDGALGFLAYKLPTVDIPITVTKQGAFTTS